MNPLLYVALCATGGLGAATRLFADGLLRRSGTTRFPFATVVINLSGSLLLGLVTGLTVGHLLDSHWKLVLGTGFLGGYTTFSTASLENIRLLQEGRIGAGLVNGIGVLVAAVALATVGYLIGIALPD
jgi:CrcB protein